MGEVLVFHDHLYSFTYAFNTDLFLQTMSAIQSQVSVGKKKKKLTVSIETRFGFSFPFPFGTRNTLLPLLCIRKYTLSRSDNPIGHQAGPVQTGRLD